MKNCSALLLRAFCALLFSVFCISTVHASYFLVNASQPVLDTQKRTHVIVTDRASDLGNLPKMAAAAKAFKIMEAFPDDQVLLILPEGSGYAHTLKSLGFENMTFVNETLNSTALMNQLEKYTQIASFHVYGHSAIPEGLFLDRGAGTKDIRWYAYDKQPLRLKGHFTQDAIATLNGCNSGHIMSLALSEMWEIPVSGSLTGTHFEKLYQDGSFYWGDSKSSGNWASDSMNSMKSKIACKGACVRLRPDNAAYNGHYGKYPQGLPSYKFSCVNISEEKCLKGMATSILMNVSNLAIGSRPTPEQYSHVVREWLCPTAYWGSNLQKSCMENLRTLNMDAIQKGSAERFYTPLQGKSFQCTFKGCYVEPKCLSPQNTLACAQKGYSTSEGRTTTFVDEYINFLRGYQYIGK
jgi:hypothetical protein